MDFNSLFFGLTRFPYFVGLLYANGILLSLAFSLQTFIARKGSSTSRLLQFNTLLMYFALGFSASSFVVSLPGGGLGDSRLGVIALAGMLSGPWAMAAALGGSMAAKVVTSASLTWVVVANSGLAAIGGLVAANYRVREGNAYFRMSMVLLILHLGTGVVQISALKGMSSITLVNGITYTLIQWASSALLAILLLVGMKRMRSEALERMRESSETIRFRALETLNRMMDASVDQLFAFGIEQGAAMCRSKISYMYRFNGSTNQLEPVAIHRVGSGACKVSDIPFTDLAPLGSFGDCLRQGKALFSNEYHHGTPELGHLQRHLHIPVYLEGELWGFLGVANCDTDYSRTELNHLGFFVDDLWRIIRRREKTSHLEEMELRYSTLFSAMNQGVIIFNTDGSVQSMNLAARTILGPQATAYHESAIPHEPRAIHEDGSPFLPSDHPSRITLETGRACTNVVMGIPTGSGDEYRWLLVNSVAIPGAMEGSIAGVFEVFSDISSERIMREHSRVFFDVSLDLLCIADKSGHFIHLNPAWENALGWSEDVLKSRPFADFVHPDDKELTTLMAATLVTEKSNVVNFVNRYQCRDGGYRWLSWNAVGLEHQPVIIAAAHDITSQREREQQLLEARAEAEKANHAKSEFLANMSHEIRTPLNAIIGFSELLDRLELDADHRAFLTAIRTAGASLLTIISDILDLSRIEAGKLEVDPIPCDLTAMLEDISTIFTHRAAEKGLHFSLEIAPGLPDQLILDPARVRQVVLNLCANAIKFTDSGQVRLRARWEAPHLRLAVSDTGPGIPKEDQERIFQSFEQQSGHISKRHGGTGLGLAISRKLAWLMDGDISLDSEPGKGSTFTVSIPTSGSDAGRVEDQGSTGGTGEQAHLAPVSCRGKTILVVDDTESNRRYLRAVLERAGCLVEESENGAKAIETAMKLQPALIFMDLRMPVMDGEEATRRLAAIQSTRHIPVLLLTAHVRSADHGQFLKSGAREVLLKPIHRADIIAALERHIPENVTGTRTTATP